MHVYQSVNCKKTVSVSSYESSTRTRWSDPRDDKDDKLYISKKECPFNKNRDCTVSIVYFHFVYPIFSKMAVERGC